MLLKFFSPPLTAESPQLGECIFKSIALFNPKSFLFKNYQLKNYNNFFREFLRRVSSTKLHQTNPKCQITTQILESRTDPSVEITFSKQ